MIVVNNQVKHQRVLGTRARCRSKEVDWNKFAEEVDDQIRQFPETNVSLLNRIRSFTGVLTRVATLVVRKVKPGKKTRVNLTPTVKAAIKKRNRIRRNIREQWLEACEQEVSEALKEAKAVKWKEVVEGALESDDEKKIWGFIRSINGVPAANAPNQTLKVNGKTLTSSRKKADGSSSPWKIVM